MAFELPYLLLEFRYFKILFIIGDSDLIAHNDYKIARAIEIAKGFTFTHPLQVRRYSDKGSPRSGYADEATVSSDTLIYP